MPELLIFLFAVAGSGLVLTQSSITEPLRSWLGSRANSTWAPAFVWRGRASRVAAKLVSCPMCAGFWLGSAWAWALGSRGIHVPAHGIAGSFVSAIGVAAWLLIAEATSALVLWRYNNPALEGVPVRGNRGRPFSCCTDLEGTITGDATPDSGDPAP